MIKAHTGECNTCTRTLNEPGVPESEDCGGDCLKCMADSFDPDCMRRMVALGHAEYKTDDQ